MKIRSFFNKNRGSTLGSVFVGFALLAVTATAALYLSKAVLLFVNQSDHVFHPTAKWSQTPADVGLVFEKVRFEAADGVPISAWFIRASGESRGAVLFFHGNTGNISDRLFDARFYSGLGYDFLIFDYRGYGQSGGMPSEMGIAKDAEAAWRYLTSGRSIPEKSIVLVGHSLGAAVAAHLAAEVNPRALVVASGFTSIPDMAAELYPLYPVRLFVRYRFDARAALKKVRCPVLVVHSPDDEVVPFRHGERLYQAANQPKRFLQISGPHTEGYPQNEAVYRGGLLSFLEDTR